MTFGDVIVTVPPIKFAFLVKPSERRKLDRATRTSRFLWVGRDRVMPDRHLR